MPEVINVNGVAIESGVSRNGILYTGEELRKFAETMVGVSIQKDHNDSVDSSIGKVTATRFVEHGEQVLFEGWIKEDGTNIVEKVKDGRVQHVSIGALVSRLVKESEDSEILIAKGIQGVELSTVIVPGVPGATITQSLKMHNNAKTDKEKLKVPAISENTNKFIKMNVESSKDVVEEKLENESEDKKMVESNVQKETSEEPEVIVKDVQENAVTEEDLQKKVDEEVNKKMTEEKVNELQSSIEEKNADLAAKEKMLAEKEAEMKEMKAQLEKVNAEKREALVESYKKLAEEKSVEAQDITEASNEVIEMLKKQLESVKVVSEKTEVKTEDKPKTKGQVGTVSEEAELDNSLMVEKSEFGNGYSLFKESYDGSSYKRLAR